MKEELCVVINREQCGKDLFEITLNAPNIATDAKAGQFVHILCGEHNMLRRPISICDVFNDCIKIIFQVKGEGTKWLSSRGKNHNVNILGPLGNGFDISTLGNNPVMIGGGIGVPPMLYTMKKAKESGSMPTAILGFRNKDFVILEADFKDIGQTYVCTDDGSYGISGFVTNILESKIDSFTSICACGPRSMLKAIWQIAKKFEIPCQVSMEERMGCGIGACLVCACELKDIDNSVKYGHVCKDGPVFNAKEVVW